MTDANKPRIGFRPSLPDSQQAYVISGEDALDLADLAGVEKSLE